MDAKWPNLLPLELWKNLFNMRVLYINLLWNRRVAKIIALCLN